ncbi:aspartic peptidase domain-containing protein [Mycena polygramma]|nr:aspartic peptidase domain-containing protein [Mycena polygramma]
MPFPLALLLLLQTSLPTFTASAVSHSKRVSAVEIVAEAAANSINKTGLHVGTLFNQNNGLYGLNMTIAGTPVTLSIDTGSTDIFLHPWPAGGPGPFDATNATGSLQYVDGTGVNGTIGLASVEFFGYHIPAQAFINVTNANNMDPSPFNGLVGLGFDSPSGPIPSGLSAANFTNASLVGKSLLGSIFDLNPDIPRFYALSLSRHDALGEYDDGSFDIGQYDPRYSEVQHAPLLPQFPEGGSDWSILTDGVFVNGSKIPWAVDPTANITDGKAKGLLDTGTSFMNLPRDVRDGIYSAIPGAVQTSENSSLGETTWVVPCETAIDLQIGFGGETFRIHPLDLSELDVLLGPDEKNYTVCKGVIFPGTEPDALFGDLFLHNVYTVFGFGNETTGGAYIQLLSLTNETSMTDYSNVRSPLLTSGPPELSPADLVQLFDGPSSSAPEKSTTASSTTPSSTSSTTSSTSSSSISTTSSTASSSPSPISQSATASSSTSSASTPPSEGVVAGDLAAAASLPTTTSSDSKVAKYGPIVIGLLGANLGLLLFLLYLGVSALVKHGRTVGSPRRTREAKYTPVRLGDDI